MRCPRRIRTDPARGDMAATQQHAPEALDHRGQDQLDVHGDAVARLLARMAEARIGGSEGPRRLQSHQCRTVRHDPPDHRGVCHAAGRPCVQRVPKKKGPGVSRALRATAAAVAKSEAKAYLAAAVTLAIMPSYGLTVSLAMAVYSSPTFDA